MSCLTYTASRNLSSGHDAGNEYSIDFCIAQADPKDTAETKETVSFGGNVSSVLVRIDKEWSVMTAPILYSTLDQWREWFHSVANKEIFIFDPTGTAASPDDPRSGYVDDKSLQYTRINPNYMQIKFNFVEFDPDESI
jgi:hypothetical protein